MAGVACTAAVDGTHAYQVDLTALHKGLAQNDIDIRFNYHGAQNGEVTPAGVGWTVTAFSGGTTNPALTTLLGNLGNQLFDYIDLPYTDATSLNALQTFLSDATGRWSAETAVRPCILGLSRHAQRPHHVRHQPQRSAREHPWLLRQPNAGVAGGLGLVRRACDAAAGQSGAGVSTQPLNLLPPPIASQDDPGERNTLLFDGSARSP